MKRAWAADRIVASAAVSHALVQGVMTRVVAQDQDHAAQV